MKVVGKNNILPEFFKPLLWSYDFSKIDLEKNKNTIILNAINYGDWKHWQWLARYYGAEEVRRVLQQRRASEIRARAGRLASVVFSIKGFNYAPRGIK